ncbi:hypothetical protein Z043_102171 [Scleropages formosus]|uniref:CFA20 domain-containing protein n=1 Tax=Scleropages formosus TaxID=113540 RepID=A0A0P7XSL8_SCLFO|nr:hypothetical protein Z043_102171 [Scleropages formosus]
MLLLQGNASKRSNNGSIDHSNSEVNWKKGQTATVRKSCCRSVSVTVYVVRARGVLLSLQAQRPPRLCPPFPYWSPHGNAGLLRQHFVSFLKERNMFKNEFQNFDKTMKGFVYILQGSSQTNKMQMPKDNKMALGLIQRFLVLQVYIPLGKDFSTELM